MMFQKILWSATPNTIRKGCGHDYFLKTVFHENSIVNDLKHDEALKKAENAYNVRRQNDIDIGTELYQLKREKCLLQKQRKRIEESEPEVRLLMQQLWRANLLKDFNEQRIANRIKREKEEQAFREESLRYRAECLNIVNEMEQKRIEKKRQEEPLKQALAKQIEYKDLLKVKKLEEKYKEREEILKIVEKEKQTLREEKRLLKERNCKEYSEEIEQVKRRKMKEKLDEAQTDYENQRLYMQELDRKEKESKKIRDKVQNYRISREAIANRIGEHVLQLEQKKKEHNELLFNLHFEENKVRVDKELQLAREKEIERMMGMQQDMERVVLQKKVEMLEKVEQQQIAHHEQFRFIEEEMRQKEEQRKQRKQLREMGRINYIKALEEQKLKCQELQAQKQLELRILLDWERQRSENIAQARQRLLQEESKDTLKYLQVGSLKPEERHYLF